MTDTPGLCDTHRDEEDVLREVGKSVAVASPGPHVILMVLRCDKRFTEVLSLSPIYFVCISLSFSVDFFV